MVVVLNKFRETPHAKPPFAGNGDMRAFLIDPPDRGVFAVTEPPRGNPRIVWLVWLLILFFHLIFRV